MGGALVLPGEEDFKKLTEKEIVEIYGEMTINQGAFEKLILDIKGKLI